MIAQSDLDCARTAQGDALKKQQSVQQEIQRQQKAVQTASDIKSKAEEAMETIRNQATVSEKDSEAFKTYQSTVTQSKIHSKAANLAIQQSSAELKSIDDLVAQCEERIAELTQKIQTFDDEIAALI